MEKKQRKQEYGDITLEKRIVSDKNGTNFYFVVSQREKLYENKMTFESLSQIISFQKDLDMFIQKEKNREKAYAVYREHLNGLLVPKKRKEVAMKTANHTLPNGVILTPEMMNRLEEWEVGKGEDYSVGGYLLALGEVIEWISLHAPKVCDFDDSHKEAVNMLCNLSLLKGDLRSFLHNKTA